MSVIQKSRDFRRYSITTSAVTGADDDDHQTLVIIKEKYDLLLFPFSCLFMVRINFNESARFTCMLIILL